MKIRFIALLAEAVISTVLAVFFVWKLKMVPDIQEETGRQLMESAEWSIRLIMLIYLAIMLLITIQSYFYIIKPYSMKIREMEAAAEESKKAEAIRKEFVANVSHELKTPLTSISGFIETLQAGAAEDPEIRTKFIDIIAIETSRLKRLIQDLLVLSDIESKKDVGTYSFNVKEAIENTVAALKPIADDKCIKILLDLDGSIYIKGSVDRFRQMIMNLTENAIKYSDDGGRVWLEAFEANGKIVVKVKDEGIGIAPEHHDRLFERFYRVDKSRSKKAGGTGLGLSIVKHIAVLFGAALEVESQVGEGTAFSVIFNKEEDKEKTDTV